MMMRKVLWVAAGLTVGAIGYPDRLRAADVTVVLGAPRLVVVLDTGVRYCDDCDEDVFFYGNVWYVYRSGGWYRRGAWGAPWVYVRQGRLPAVFLKVPPGRFKHRYGRYHPAHEHHPQLDTWNHGRDSHAGQGRREGRSEVRSGRPAADPDAAQGNDKDKDKKDGKKGKDKRGGHGRH